MKTGIFDKARLVSNVLMVILVAGNIFFSIQYTQNMIREREAEVTNQAKDQVRAKSAIFLRSFIEIVLNTQGTVSMADRVKLEDQILQTGDADLIKAWNTFVNSGDGTVAQANAVKLMNLLAIKLI